MGLFHRVRHPNLPSSISEITPKPERKFLLFGRKRRELSPTRASQTPQIPADDTFENDPNAEPPRKDLTRGRRKVIYIAECAAVVSIAFAILVNIGCVNRSKTLSDIYFIRLDLSHIVPVSIPNAVLINSVAQSLGLRDYYQVGMWGYCEGYKDSRGTTFCSPPKTLYWFDPVTILTSQLLAGATIALPSELTSILNIVRIVSHGMFGCFLSGACVMTVNLMVGWLPIYSRWWSGLIGTLAFCSAALLIVASGIATALFVVFQRVFVSQQQFSIGAKLGLQMFVFMWITAGFALVNFISQVGMCCCFTSKRKMRRKYAEEDEKERRWAAKSAVERERGRSASRGLDSEDSLAAEKQRQRRDLEAAHVDGLGIAPSAAASVAPSQSEIPKNTTVISRSSSRLSKQNPRSRASSMTRR